MDKDGHLTLCIEEITETEPNKTIVFTEEEKRLDQEIKATINRNLLQNQRINYLKMLQYKRQQRRKRFGLKFK